MEFITDILPFIAPIVTYLGGRFLERRMTAANAVKTEAEAKRVLAEAEKILAEADSEEARTMGAIIAAYKTLFDETKADNALIRAEQQKAHAQYQEMQTELAWYRRGVAILIRQMERLNIVPEWTPDMPRGGGG